MCSSKRPERRGVREHEAGGVLVDLRSQVVEVEVPPLVRLDLLELIAGHRDARRVRAVGRVGGDHGRPLLALSPVGEVGAHEHESGELALRAGCRLERDRVEPCDLCQDLLQAPHQLERALRPLLLLMWVQVTEARQHDDSLVDARVVLHRARAERVEPRVDAEGPIGERREVPDDLGLGELRQARRALAPERFREIDLRHVVERQARGAASGLRLLEDQLHAPATSSRTAAKRSMSAGLRFSVTQTSSASSRPS